MNKQVLQALGLLVVVAITVTQWSVITTALGRVVYTFGLWFRFHLVPSLITVGIAAGVLWFLYTILFSNNDEN